MAARSFASADWAAMVLHSVGDQMYLLKSYHHWALKTITSSPLSGGSPADCRAWADAAVPCGRPPAPRSALPRQGRTRQSPRPHRKARLLAPSSCIFKPATDLAQQFDHLLDIRRGRAPADEAQTQRALAVQAC